jgi:hypothetical protein
MGSLLRTAKAIAESGGGIDAIIARSTIERTSDQLAPSTTSGAARSDPAGKPMAGQCSPGGPSALAIIATPLDEIGRHKKGEGKASDSNGHPSLPTTPCPVCSEPIHWLDPLHRWHCITCQPAPAGMGIAMTRGLCNATTGQASWPVIDRGGGQSSEREGPDGGKAGPEGDAAHTTTQAESQAGAPPPRRRRTTLKGGWLCGGVKAGVEGWPAGWL